MSDTLTPDEIGALLEQQGFDTPRRMTPEEFAARRRECRLKAMAAARARYPLVAVRVRLAPPLDEDGGCALPVFGEPGA